MAYVFQVYVLCQDFCVTWFLSRVKAVRLLQQTKTKGSASLVFSYASTSPGHTPLAKETSPPVIPSLPLTAQGSPTRDSGKSSEASAEQGSSSRRSSTVDAGDYSTRVVGRKKSSKKSSLGSSYCTERFMSYLALLIMWLQQAIYFVHDVTLLDLAVYAILY